MNQTGAGTFAAGLCILAISSMGSEGRITAVSTQGGQATSLLCAVGKISLRLEVTGSDQPNPVDLLDLQTGTLTLVFPHNRSFVKLRTANAGADSPVGAGPQRQMHPPTAAVVSAAVGLPMMPIPSEAMELKAIGQKTNLLGLPCERYEIKRRGEVMEIWATDALLPFQDYVHRQPPSSSQRLLEEQWAELLAARKLFPLRASLRLQPGGERFRFEVLSINPKKVSPEDAQLFLPPPGYSEIQPLPF